MKYVYQKQTGIVRAYVSPRSIKVSRISDFKGRIEARIDTEFQLECGHWSSTGRDSYQSRKSGFDVHFCRECNGGGDRETPELNPGQDMAIDAIVRMLEGLGYKIEKP